MREKMMTRGKERMKKILKRRMTRKKMYVPTDYPDVLNLTFYSLSSLEAV